MSLSSFTISKQNKENKARRATYPSKYVATLQNRIVVLYGNPATGKSTLISKLARIQKEVHGKPAKIYWCDLILAKDSPLSRKLRAMSQADIEIVKFPWELEYKLRHLDPEKYSMVAIDSVSGMYEAIEGSVIGPRINLEMKRWASKYIRILLEKQVEEKLPLAILVFHETAIFGGDFFGMPTKPNISTQILKNVEIILRTTREDKEVKEKKLRYFYVEFIFHRYEPYYEGVKILQSDFLGENKGNSEESGE